MESAHNNLEVLVHRRARAYLNTAVITVVGIKLNHLCFDYNDRAVRYNRLYSESVKLFVGEN